MITVVGKHDPSVLRYAFGCDSDYESVLARIIQNKAGSNLSEQYVNAVCNIVESVSQKLYLSRLCVDSTAIIKSSAPEFTARVDGVSMTDCCLAGIQYGDSEVTMLLPGYVGFIVAGDIVGTCPYDMYRMLLIKANGRLISTDELKFIDNPYMKDATIVKFVESLDIDDTTECADLTHMLEYVLRHNNSTAKYARFIWIDGAAIPVDKEGSVVGGLYE